MTELEFEYADYCINKLRDSDQAADDIDWQNRKTHRYDDRLSNKEIEEVRAILVAEKWIERYQRTTMYSLNKSKLTILKEHGSYSNYCKFLDKENQLLKSSFNDKLQLETVVLKLQKENLEKSSKIRLDVFELINRQPILNYRISVVDRVIISVDNKDITPKGVSKVIDLLVREKLEIFELTDDEKLGFSNQLTHKFKIKSFGKIFLFLNLTDSDLINLGFIENPPIIKFKLNENKRWFIGLSVMALIGIAAIIFNNANGSKASDTKDTNQIQQEQKPTPSINQSEFSQSDSLTVPVDSTNISKNESLTKKLK
jgi:hypothetical protein